MITVKDLIEVLNEVENKDIPVYIAEQKKKKTKETDKGNSIYEVKNKYEIINGGQSFMAFILAFDKDKKI